MGRGNCSIAALAGTALAGANPTEYELALMATRLACQANAAAQAEALVLILVCQCHNTNAQNAINAKAAGVLQLLRRRGGCEAPTAVDYPGAR